MERANIAAVASMCRQTIQEFQCPQIDLPAQLQPQHLQWMCDQVEEHATDWPEGKLHRWLGFIQCGLMANRMIDLEGLRTMIGEVKLGHDASNEDLLDHLDPTSSFRLDIGGEG